MLHAVARDGNDRMYPVAMAVVEAECKDSWSWFLENLVAVIGSVEEFGWTFISDRQKVIFTYKYDKFFPYTINNYKCMISLN